jgi:murein L,D-transpeptidase YafK
MGGVAALAGCAGDSKFRSYNGPEVTRVIVDKGKRDMFLLHHRKVLKRYKVHLGFAPAGHKRFEGDGRTPEGHYLVDRRNPNSDYHLSIGISYPDPRDIAYAEAMGLSPGGDIFIHGEPNEYAVSRTDWTAGCIAVTNSEIENVYAMVRNGTPITIRA